MGIESLKSRNPATGEPIGEVRASSPEEVREAVAAARKVAPEWASLPLRDRARHVAELRFRIFEHLDPIVETIATENGKPRAEALAHDVLPTLLTLQYLERLAPRALRPQRVGRVMGPLTGMASHIEWRPYGVVGCISPWNYPFLLSLMAVAPALLAGNAVVLKPSEVTPGVGERIREVLDVLPSGVATVVQGGGEVGAALVDAPCDKLCFIGSPGTGRRIAEAAARHLTPVVMELGGQDATIVCRDADLDVAASGVLWGAFLNAGQTCCAIERAYVVDSVADEFERLLVEKLARVRTGTAGADIGPLTVERQAEIVRRHVEDAVQNGARVLAGGSSEPTDGDGLWVRPTILSGRSEEMAIFREETFGPVLPVIRVRDENEAVRRANEEGFNLTASVWTRDRRRARRVASELRAGTVSVNDHASTPAAPWGVWGGVGESGYGRLHGEPGLREFTVPVHVARNTMPRTKRVWWYPYDDATTGALRSFTGVVGAPRLVDKARALGGVLRNGVRAIRGKI